MTYAEAAKIAERQTQATGRRWWAACDMMDACGYYATDGKKRVYDATEESKDKEDT